MVRKRRKKPPWGDADHNKKCLVLDKTLGSVDVYFGRMKDTALRRVCWIIGALQIPLHMGFYDFTL